MCKSDFRKTYKITHQNCHYSNELLSSEHFAITGSLLYNSVPEKPTKPQQEF